MLNELERKLKIKRARVLARYNCYEMKNGMKNYGIAVPDSMKAMVSVLGWCAKSVDGLADRLTFRGFAGDDFNIMKIYEHNNPDMLFDSAVTSALVGSCAFVYIAEDEDGYPTLQVVDGANATGKIDETTGMLTEGYAVLKRDDKGAEELTAYFEPYRTVYYEGVNPVREFEHPVPFPLLVPIIHRPDAVRPFGRSRISRACMRIMQDAREVVRLSMVAAQFYSFPQRYVVGTDDNLELDRWRAAVSTMFNISKGEDGTIPNIGQFQQQSMEPLFSQLKIYASLFSGETGISLQELGFTDANPASADAIISGREGLLLNARKAQRNFGSGFLNAGIAAASLRDKTAYNRHEFRRTKPEWYPVFEPNLSTLGDSIIKINQAVPGFFDRESISKLSGIDVEDRAALTLNAALSEETA
ncbi:MAG: hypothetical protein LBS85_00020 [Clostridiales Family XIII bacterium]|jgi:hypothetical protein|nr:hypothetical protein [Clostridiales Family XIII bacterium]